MAANLCKSVLLLKSGSGSGGSGGGSGSGGGGGSGGNTNTTFDLSVVAEETPQPPSVRPRIPEWHLNPAATARAGLPVERTRKFRMRVSELDPYAR